MRTRFVQVATVTLTMLLCNFASFAEQPPPAQNSTDDASRLCTLSGTVVSANTGEPIKKAEVLIRDREKHDRNQAYTAFTDAEGRFTIGQVPAGSYEMGAERTNYETSNYGQTAPGGSGAILTLADGQNMNDLLFRLRRLAVVTGKVTDKDGEPIVGMDVTAVDRSSLRGNAKPKLSRTNYTDDRGVYRIFDIPPGKYIVLVTPPNPENSDRGAVRAKFYATTYYSNTTERSRAAILDVKSGDEIAGIDIGLVPKLSPRVFTIWGQVNISLPDLSSFGAG